MLGNPDRPIGGLAVQRPPGVELRPLGRDDGDVAVGLARQARGLSGAELSLARWERLVNDPDVTPFLALADGSVAGLVVLEFRRRLNFATFEGWLSDLFVEPRHRGRGIGRLLVDAAVAEWRLRQGHRLQASVPAPEAAARALVERAGFVEWMREFRLAPVAAGDAPPPDGVTIRPASPDDGQAVTRLIAEFGPHRSPVPDRMEAVLRTFVAHLRAVEAGAGHLLLAELDGHAVGVCGLTWREPFWTDARQAWIHDLVVTEPVRGRGIGRALLAAALAAAVEEGVEAVELESGLRRESAHRLYRSTGFVETGATWVLQRDD